MQLMFWEVKIRKKGQAQSIRNSPPPQERAGSRLNLALSHPVSLERQRRLENRNAPEAFMARLVRFQDKTISLVLLLLVLNDEYTSKHTDTLAPRIF